MDTYTSRVVNHFTKPSETVDGNGLFQAFLVSSSTAMAAQRHLIRHHVALKLVGWDLSTSPDQVTDSLQTSSPSKRVPQQSS